MSKNIVIRTPGKVILAGEHAVVYGYPAIVAAVNLYLTLSVEVPNRVDHKFFSDLLNRFEGMKTSEVIEEIRVELGDQSISLKSQIPIGCGMGSSAALASALSLLILLLADKEHGVDEVNRYAFVLERSAHGNPSGVDNTIVTKGGIIKYLRAMGDKPAEFVPLTESIAKSELLKKLVIVNTGKPKESTGEMVTMVREFSQSNSNEFEKDMQSISQATAMLTEALHSGDERKFSEAIRMNELALESLGVVGDVTKKFIREIESLGAVAKISGAGGFRKASGIILVYPGDRREVAEYLNKSRFFTSQLSISDGIKYEINEKN